MVFAAHLEVAEQGVVCGRGSVRVSCAATVFFVFYLDE